MNATTEQHDAMIRSAQATIDNAPRVLPVKELLPILYDCARNVEDGCDRHPDGSYIGTCVALRMTVDELVASVYGLTPKEAAVT